LGVFGFVFLLGGILFMLINSFLIWRVRRHPIVKGLSLGGIIAIVCILIHSITDFNLQIPANMMLFSVVLSLAIVTAFYKKNERNNKLGNNKE
jgi:chromate transport protein ChrA